MDYIGAWGVMKAWIINIGNEILIGKVVNTNATWLAQRLTNMGFEVKRIICIPDEENDIINTIREGIAKADIIITTGGLGPTYDDKTSECIAKALKLEWVINEEALKEIEKKYREKGMELTRHRIKMAKMPDGARPLRNSVGTAPGIYLKFRNTTIISLPGVPSEMKAIFNEEVEPILLKERSRKIIGEQSLIITGIPESGLAPIIEKVMEEVEGVYIKSHPRGHEIRGPKIEIHIMTFGENEEETEEKLRKTINLLNKYLQTKT